MNEASCRLIHRATDSPSDFYLLQMVSSNDCVPQTIFQTKAVEARRERLAGASSQGFCAERPLHIWPSETGDRGLETTAACPTIRLRNGVPSERVGEISSSISLGWSLWACST
jgi:hypothetical protein